MINPIWRGRLAIGDVLIPLRPHDPVAALIHAALTLRRLVRDGARDVMQVDQEPRALSAQLPEFGKLTAAASAAPAA